MSEVVNRMHMPVIGPPPLGVDPTSYYNSLGINITSTSFGEDGIKFEFDTQQILYAKSDGFIRFIPPGTNLPDSSIIVAGSGAIVIEVAALVLDGLIRNDFNTSKKLLPDGIPTPVYIVYENADENLFSTQVAVEVSQLPDKILDESWKETETSDPASIPRPLKEAKYIERLILGQKSVWIFGGKNIGATTLNINGKHEFILRFLKDGLLNSPVFFERRFPEFVDKFGTPVSKWTNHPLIQSTNNITVPLNIYIRFEVWNSNSLGNPALPEYVPVDAGATVKLIDYDITTPSDVVTAITNSNGEVMFNLDPITTMGAERPDLFFKIIKPMASASGLTLPSEWSTFKIAGEKFWEAKDGSPGYYEDFFGSAIGSINNPVIFRIGVDYHIKLEYHDKIALKKRACYGFPFQIKTGVINTIAEKSTDDKGEIHGITFDIEPGQNVYFRVPHEIEDTSINLKKSTSLLADPAGGWISLSNDIDKIHIPDIKNTSIGTNKTPKTITLFESKRCLSLSILKNLREWATFFYQLTSGANEWQGVEIALGTSPVVSTPFSWPIGQIWFSPDYYTPPLNQLTRETIVHEVSHQIMWVLGGYDSILDWLSLYTQIRLIHSIYLIDSETHALVEGWCEAVSLIFIGASQSISSAGVLIQSSVNPVVRNLLHFAGGTPNHKLGPPPLHRGEKNEGALANAIAELFWEKVLTNQVYNNPALCSKNPVTGQPCIEESTNGDITSTTPWLNMASVSNRFKKYFWDTFIQLDANDIDKSSSKLLENIILSNPNDAHEIRAIFNSYNLFITTPVLTSLSPTLGGNNTIIIADGTGFIENYTNRESVKVELKVYFGSKLGVIVDVISDKQVKIKAPSGTSGSNVNVKIDMVLTSPLSGTAPQVFSSNFLNFHYV